jgi:hypothetical protein
MIPVVPGPAEVAGPMTSSARNPQSMLVDLDYGFRTRVDPE